ncbi:MAG: TetR/AcrR family transcriptional regulator [Clostridia bacterium]|nr:TetR/AcrR family transcriptional regulator [Clostridia bacterium]
MNVKNNRRRRESQEKIEKAFIELIQTREIQEIAVADIIRMTGLNRSTFYANYLDIYDLADKIRKKLEEDFSSMFTEASDDNEQNGSLKMFRHIYENQIFYKTYFKLQYDERQKISIYDRNVAIRDGLEENIEYHIEFFRHGLNAIIKMWLAGGCRETPEQMVDILKREYRRA